MRAYRQFFSAAAAAMLTFAIATPALANEGTPMPGPASYAPDAGQRDRWVDECSERLASGYHHERRKDRLRERDRQRENCARYYDSYYEYYNGQYRAWQPGAQTTHYQPRRVQNGACDPSPDCRRNCVETVEYEEVEVPVRAAPRPSKRIRVAPDKRIRLK